MHRSNKKSKSRGKIIWDKEPTEDEETGILYLWGRRDDGEPVCKEYDIPNDPSQIRDHDHHENQAFHTFGSSSTFQPGSPDAPSQYGFNPPYSSGGMNLAPQGFSRENPTDDDLYETSASALGQTVLVEGDGSSLNPDFPPFGLPPEGLEMMHGEGAEGDDQEEEDDGEDDGEEEEDEEDSDEDSGPVPQYPPGPSVKMPRPKDKAISKSHSHRHDRKEKDSRSHHSRHPDHKDKDSKRDKKDNRSKRDKDEQESRRSRKDSKQKGKETQKSSRTNKGKERADGREGDDHGYRHAGEPRMPVQGDQFMQPLPLRPGPVGFMAPVLEDPDQDPLDIPNPSDRTNPYPADQGDFDVESWPGSAEVNDDPDEDDDPALMAAIAASRDSYWQPDQEGGPSSGPAYDNMDDRSGSQTPRPIRNYAQVRVSKQDRIKGTQGDAEPLDRRYKICHSSAFSPGMVFKILWFEPKGNPAGGGSKVSELVKMRDAKKDFYVGFRRFIVIANDEGHCTCVPILTYGRQGCNKPGVKAKQHGIIYLYEQQWPLMLPGEPELGFAPVRIIIDARNESISEESRVNYSKLVNVEHNVKVFFIGRIYEEDANIVFDAVDQCWERKIRKQRGAR